MNLTPDHFSNSFPVSPISSYIQYGRIRLNHFLYFFIPLLIFAPLFSYYTAVTNNEAKAFPHTTITNMSRFYPQDVVFRYLMLPAGGFIQLIYFVLGKWITKIKTETGYPGNTELWLIKLGQWSVLGYYGAIATIDGGNLPMLHIIGAIFFFIFLLLITGTMTIILIDMHSWSASVISRGSLFIKTLLAGYIIIVALYSIFGAIKEKVIPDNEDDKYMVIA